MVMSELKQRLFKTELAKAGFPNAVYVEGLNVLSLDPHDKRLPTITGNGDIVHNSENVHPATLEIRKIIDRVNEIDALWENAVSAPFAWRSNYRMLCEYNAIVLAARDDGSIDDRHGLCFVTWVNRPDRVGFDNGHYTTDYERAKEDFATRSGLINRYKMFDETELLLLRQGLVFLGSSFPDLTMEQMTNVGKLMEKVEMVVPTIHRHERLEEQLLVPDDGLEL